MKRNHVLFVLGALIIIGATLRFYKLGEIPNSLNWDEVSWGYNGYSIWETGRDEHGEFLPLSFKAFGDYKQPVYVYLDALSIGIFGLNVFAVRFPSALLGTLSIVITYLFIKELVQGNKGEKGKKGIINEYIPLVVAGLIALSPWSIQFSRVAFEANVGQFFVILGAWLFVKGVNTKQWNWLFLSTVPLAISAFTYHSEKLFTPLFFCGLLLFGHRYFLSQKKKTVILIIFFILINLPWILDSRTTARGRSVTFASNQTQLLEDSLGKLNYENEQGLLLGKVFYNRRIEYAKKYAENYLLHFDPNLLFIKGDNARHHAPGMGVLYLVSLPFILIGIRELLQQKSRATFLLFFWFFLAPVAAALAIEAPNASRSLIFLPVWQVFEGIGVVGVFWFFKNKKYGRIILLFFGSLFVLNMYYFIHQYFAHTNTDMAQYWQYGYEQAVKEIASVSPDVTVHFDQSIEQGYIFYLFHTAYPPQRYISNGGLTKQADDCVSLGNVLFGVCSNYVPQPDDMTVTAELREGKTVVSIGQYGQKHSYQ